MEYERKKAGRSLRGLGAAAGMVAVLMMPEQSHPEAGSKAADKMEDVAWKISDTLSDKFEDM